MRVFVAGGTGVIGRRLVPQLVARGHQVTATTTSAAKLGLLRQLGADGVVMDALDAVSVGEAVAAARPDAIVNQITGLSEAHTGKPNLRKPDRFFAATNRLRSQGTDHLLAEWLPYLAACAGAKPPRRLPKWLARLLAGEMVVGMMTTGRAFSNAKAKRELGWELRYPSWRQGFKEELA